MVPLIIAIVSQIAYMISQIRAIVSHMLCTRDILNKKIQQSKKNKIKSDIINIIKKKISNQFQTKIKIIINLIINHQFSSTKTQMSIIIIWIIPINIHKINKLSVHLMKMEEKSLMKNLWK